MQLISIKILKEDQLQDPSYLKEKIEVNLII